MEDANINNSGIGSTTVSSSPSYWLDACEDISCDFIDFDVSSVVVSDSQHQQQHQHQQQQPDSNNASNQDFFGGIDRILDSIKNGAGLPLPLALHLDVQPQHNSNSNHSHDAASKLLHHHSSNSGGEGEGGGAQITEEEEEGSCDKQLLSNGNEGGVLTTYSHHKSITITGRDLDLTAIDGDEEQRYAKRARLNACKNNDRPYYARPNCHPKERFFNNRKRPRDRDEIDTRRDRDGVVVVRKKEHCGTARREQRGYWERDKLGSNDLVFRFGTWEADRNRQHKIMPNDTKQEINGKLDDHKKSEKEKEEEAKERVPEEKARQYQLDVLEQAKSKNTIAFLETGAGKTLIAVLLIKSIHDSLKNQNKKMLAVFLVPKVPLVYQQAEVIRERTGYQVGHYCGEMGQDFWDARRWQREFDNKHVLVMTAQILLNILRHSIIKMEEINLLILDECHHAVKKHPYSLVMSEFYHTTPKEKRPSVFGMTASPVNLKGRRCSTEWDPIICYFLFSSYDLLGD